MKELQKYYAENPMSLAIDDIGPYYDASEADAAFAEMRRQNNNFVVELNEIIAALKQQYAEEIERLKAALKHYAEPKNCEQFWIDEYYRYRKQAERYEKLRRLNWYQLLSLSKEMRHSETVVSLDALVDQLPASGEAQK